MALKVDNGQLTWIQSRGVTHPAGFKAASIACGLKKDKADLALIVADVPCAVAGVFTQNLVKASSVDYSRAIVQHGTAQAIFCKAGNANACTGEHGEKVTRGCGTLVAEGLGIDPNEVLVAATGVIGRKVPFEKIEAGAPLLVKALGNGSDTDQGVAKAITTTDTFEKQVAVTVTSEHWQGELRIGGICKGSGMIAPNMATTLCFLTTDASVSPKIGRASCRERV